jgi:hypothetical protein
MLSKGHLSKSDRYAIHSCKECKTRRKIPLLRSDVDCDPGILNRVLEFDLLTWLGRVKPHTNSCSLLCGSHLQRDILNNVGSPHSSTQTSATIKLSQCGAICRTQLERKADDNLLKICSKRASWFMNPSLYPSCSSVPLMNTIWYCFVEANFPTLDWGWQNGWIRPTRHVARV